MALSKPPLPSHISACHTVTAPHCAMEGMRIAPVLYQRSALSQASLALPSITILFGVQTLNEREGVATLDLHVCGEHRSILSHPS